MVCRSCGLIQNNALTFIEFKGKPVISLCCEPIPDIPHIEFEETPEESFRKFVGECRIVDLECRGLKDDSKRFFTKGCVNCSQFQQGNYYNDGLVHYVNLSIYPAPCQCRCIYCDVHTKDQNTNTESAIKLYDHIFAFLELAIKYGLIADNVIWQVSSGEIAIHPHHDRIMKFLKGKTATFYTNCIKFDEDIAQNLNDNPNSAINLSIDAGTRETWHKVKGIDNFDRVTENLSKYFVKTTHPGQITLKYIILPGINDTYEDFTSIVEIMKVLNVKHLTIARDLSKKYDMSKQDIVNLTGAAAYLLAILYKNNMSADMFTYSPEEMKMSIDQANEIASKGLI